jgi:hypothetical protein
MYVSYAGGLGLGLGLGSSDRARTSRPVLWGSQRAEHDDAAPHPPASARLTCRYFPCMHLHSAREQFTQPCDARTRASISWIRLLCHHVAKLGTMTPA